MRPELEATKVVGRPKVLLIYGDGDRYTPPAHGQLLEQALQSTAEVEMWVIPEVEHTFAYRIVPQEYESRVVPFLREALGS